MPDVLTTASVAYDPDSGQYTATMIVAAHPASVAKAIYALGIEGRPVHAGERDTRMVLPIHASDPVVAQAAAEGIARAIGHVLPVVTF